MTDQPPLSTPARRLVEVLAEFPRGLTVTELTEGTIVANLGYDKVVHPHPVFHGDTIYAESEIIEKRESKSRPNAGIVRIKCTGKKPDSTIVVEFERTALFLKKK